MDRPANHRHGPQENVEKTVGSIEGIALPTLAGLTVLVCFIIPGISQGRPYMGPSVSMHAGKRRSFKRTISFVMIMTPVPILLLPLIRLSCDKERRHLPPYISSQPAPPVTADSPRCDINGTG